MEAAFRVHPLWSGCSEEELESAGEVSYWTFTLNCTSLLGGCYYEVLDGCSFCFVLNSGSFQSIHSIPDHFNGKFVMLLNLDDVFVNFKSRWHLCNFKI